MSAKLADDELLISRTFDAPASLMFELWTDPAHFKNWMGPGSYECQHAEMDLRVGGAYRYVMRRGDEQIGFSGTYLELNPPKGLAYTQIFDPFPDAAVKVSITLTPMGTETLLVSHEEYPSAEARSMAISAGMEHGMRETMEQLSLLLQELWGESLATTGAALVPSPLIATFVSPIAGRYADRIGHRWILAGGSLLCALPYLSYTILLDEAPAVWTVFVPVSLCVGVGVGATIATWASAGLADVRPALFGTANATVRTTQQVGYALGISVIVAILADVSIDPKIENFRWAWFFVGGSYLAAAVVVAFTFPSGSSDARAA